MKLILTLSREARKHPFVEICTAKPVDKGADEKPRGKFCCILRKKHQKNHLHFYKPAN